MEIKKFAFGPYSPSRLESIRCPEEFRSKVLLRRVMPGTSQGPLHKGSLVHELFERIFNAKIAGDPLTMPLVDSWIAELIKKFPAAFEYLHDVIKPATLSLLTKPHNEIPYYDHIDEIEKAFAINYKGEECGFDDPDCAFRSKIDIYANNGDMAIMIDHKTQLNIEQSDTRKMLFYAWLACRSDSSIKKVSMILNFCHPDLNFFNRPVEISRDDLIEHTKVISKEKADSIERKVTAEFNGDVSNREAFSRRDYLLRKESRMVEIPFEWLTQGYAYSEKDLREHGLIKDEEITLNKDDDSIESQIFAELKVAEGYYGTEGVWPTVPHRYCERCPSYYDCPARTKINDAMVKAGVKLPENMEDAQSLMRQLLIVEDQVKILKAALKDFLKSDRATSPGVAYSDREYATRTSVSYEFNKSIEGMKEFMKKELKLNPYTYMKFDTKMMNTLLNDIEEPEKQIQFKNIAPIKFKQVTKIYKL